MPPNATAVAMSRADSLHEVNQMQRSSVSTNKTSSKQERPSFPCDQNIYSAQFQAPQEQRGQILQVANDPVDSRPRPTGTFQGFLPDFEPEGHRNYFDAAEGQDGGLGSHRAGQQQPYSSQDAHLSVLNLDRANEDEEMRRESFNDGEVTVTAVNAKRKAAGKSDHELTDGSGALTKSPKSYRVQSLKHVELILDSEREEVVSKNLNYLSEQVHKEGGAPNEEVGRRMK